MQNPQRKKNPSAFLRNIFSILQNSQLNEYVEWAPEGNGFIIKNLPYFQANILPQYFKHKKYSSFVRQLNMYGFHKQRNSSFQNCFLHQQFKKGQQLPTDIKRKPQKKKKVNEFNSFQNLSKSSDWFSIGQEFRNYFPQIAKNILIKSEQQQQIKQNKHSNYKNNTIILSKQRKCSIQNMNQQNRTNYQQKVKKQLENSQEQNNKIKSQQLQNSQESQQYISKISLKGLIFDQQNKNNDLIQNQNQSQSHNQQQQGEKLQNSKIYNDKLNNNILIAKTRKNEVSSFGQHCSNQQSQDRSESIQSQSYDKPNHDSKSLSSKRQKRQMIMSQNKQRNKTLQLLKQKQSKYNELSFMSNISMNTLQSLNGISQMLIKQNQILIRTQPMIRNMILKSQKNKIQYLNQSIKLEDMKQSRQIRQNIQKIIQSQKQQLLKLTNMMEQQMINLSQIAMNDEYNPISTTSIRFRLQKNV